MEFLSDLILFAPEVWLGLFSTYNRAIWPGHGLALGVALLLFWTIFNSHDRNSRFLIITLGLCWIWVGVGYHLIYFTSINWTAYGFASLFVLQGVSLLWVAVFDVSWSFRYRASIADKVGVIIIVFAVIILPLTGFADGRTWQQLDTFGTGPDTTALATVGLLQMERSKIRWRLIIIPAIWAFIAFATAWPLDMIQGMLLLPAALLSLFLLLTRGER